MLAQEFIPDDAEFTGPTRTVINKRDYLRLLVVTPSYRWAAGMLGISSTTGLNWRKKDPAFAQQEKDAVTLALGLLEDTAFDRAHQGSDSLIRFLLERKLPEYRAKGSMDVNVSATEGRTADTSDMDDAALDAEIFELEERLGLTAGAEECRDDEAQPPLDKSDSHEDHHASTEESIPGVIIRKKRTED